MALINMSYSFPLAETWWTHLFKVKRNLEQALRSWIRRPSEERNMIQILMMTRTTAKCICKSSFVYAWYISKDVFYKAYCFSLHLHIMLIFLCSFIQLSHSRKKLKYFFSLFWKSFVIQKPESFQLNNVTNYELCLKYQFIKCFEVTVRNNCTKSDQRSLWSSIQSQWPKADAQGRVKTGWAGSNASPGYALSNLWLAELCIWEHLLVKIMEEKSL